MLIKDFVSGITDAQYRKLKKYSSRVRASLNASDIVQHTLLKMLKSQQFANKNQMSYLYKSVYNNASKAYARRKILASKHMEMDEVEKYQLLRYEQIFSNEQYLLSEAILTLPPKQKLVIEMTLDGHSNLDIAKELNITYNTAKAQYRHAMLKIKEYVTKEIKNGH
jgi:RNA polymerase sigma factor (sigma-70 family)